ncbi:hypothetical protein [Halobacillus litoralis]|uniref:hypothetical protein n=1 Tax=Halobacillus litoralis TaxID=45668 RepID=UPI001CFF499D|nr:hypothetical protein [Halobacillus litoralis]
MKKTLILAVLLISAACQQGGVDSKEAASEKETATIPLKEEPTLILQLDGEKMAGETIWECWVEYCSKESAFPSNVYIEGETDHLQPVSITRGERVKVRIRGEKPDQLSYMMQEEGHVESKSVEEDSFSVYGEGKQHFLLTAEWSTEEGDFQGSKTIGFVLNVKEPEGGT